jgi:hypothetical protein
MAEKYHVEVQALYRSRHAGICYGKGGQVIRDNESYSRGYHRRYGPVCCLAAGVRLDDEVNPSCVIIENYRGKEIVRLPWPASE